MTPPSTDINQQEVLSNLSYLLRGNKVDFVRNILADLHAADIADLVEHMPPEERDKIFSILDSEIAGEVLAEMENAPREDVLEEMDSSKIAELVNEMDSDDATDVIDAVREFSADKALEVLGQVEDEVSEDIQELMHYAEDTAGGIMAKEYVAVNANWFVEEAIKEVRDKSEEVDELYQVYVVDDFGHLVGYVPLRELFLARPHMPIKQIMNTDVYAIDSDMDQEKVAQIFEKYNLVSAPVINKSGQLIGRITIDDILDVINQETDEDLARIAGIGEEEILEDSVFRIVQARLPWLLISFFGEIGSAMIMQSFDATLNQILASAFFIPLVMAMGGSIGQQSSIIVVRGLGTGEINPRDLGRRLSRETKAALLNGLVIGSLIFVIVAFWLNDLHFGIVLSVSLMIVVMNASLFGSMIPFGLRKINVDPAIASGPFVATFNDVVGLLLYFSLLSVAFKYHLLV